MNADFNDATEAQRADGQRGAEVRRRVTELIVALDLPTSLEARGMLNRLVRETEVRWFKVGPRLAFSPGFPELCAAVVTYDRHLFVDLKLCGTQDTVRATAAAMFYAGAEMITVHATPRMLHMSMKTKTEKHQRVLAVGQLTDAERGIGEQSYLRELENLHQADGLVCSVAMANWLKKYAWERVVPGKLLVCPGIRRPHGDEPSWTDVMGPDNHVHPSTPAEARDAGADFIVVGRPIINAPNPSAATRAIMEELRP